MEYTPQNTLIIGHRHDKVERYLVLQYHDEAECTAYTEKDDPVIAYGSKSETPVWVFDSDRVVEINIRIRDPLGIKFVSLQEIQDKLGNDYIVE